ncbi:MAG: FAD-dependent oxidoreductase [Flavobacteriaceae bacterium]|nr:FAD-dependent oxidoreductase [Flavobacteriaceae bacterium]
MKNKKTVIIGAGINGLISANYLKKNGFDVTILEKSNKIGGACTSEKTYIENKQINYSVGATVFGMMPNFIFKETGLEKKVRVFSPNHPKIVYFPGDDIGTKIFKDPRKLSKELKKKWDENGNLISFRNDEKKVVDFIRNGFKNAETPTVYKAIEKLGLFLTNLWIKGSARDLLNHYFTSEKTKTYMGMTVIESGPTSFNDPFSSFTIPLMDSGSVFKGYWGYVKEGIGKITENLNKINNAIGITTLLNINIESINSKNCEIKLINNDKKNKIKYDYLVFATDPVTPSILLRNSLLKKKLDSKKYTGSSGKITAFFRNPVVWKESSEYKDSDSAFRFIFSVDNLDDFEKNSQRVINPNYNYEPGYIQIYCEGAAQRKLNNIEAFDKLILFTKNFSFNKKSEDLEVIKNKILDKVFCHIKNPEDCIYSNFLTPLDLKNKFHFPEGNIDHIMLTDKQTFMDRSYSNDPKNKFYQYSNYENIFYCGAGAYPCGSVGGTAGYMLAKQLIKLQFNSK